MGAQQSIRIGEWELNSRYGFFITITQECAARADCAVQAGSMDRLSFGGLAIRRCGDPLPPAGFRCRLETGCVWRKNGSECLIACGDGRLLGTIRANDNLILPIPSPQNAPLRKLVIVLIVCVVRWMSASGFGPILMR